MGKLIGSICLIAISILLMIFRGYVTVDLWQWFLVPLGLKSITVAHAIGLSFIVGLLFNLGRLTHSDVNKDEATLTHSAMRMAVWFVMVAMTWGSAAIVHYNFM